jgi:hypothetical protein
MTDKKLPVGLQDFSEIRRLDNFYLDKTKYIHETLGIGKYFFLSRPRRFGKSLFTSTLKYFFQGRKDLFTGLYIENHWDWTQQFPVINISFSNIGHTSYGLERAIDLELNSIAESFNIVLESEKMARKFKELIQKLQPLGKVVILIDEYDKPILDYLGKDDDLAVKNRDTLKGFYSVLKDADAMLRFVFITGVTKFSKVSIFSELNNLTDLTMHGRFGGICGVTQAELDFHFAEELTQIDRQEVKRWYNGYTWDLKNQVYNPFSLFSFFSAGEFKNFWFESGTPTFLVNLMLDFGMFDTEEVEVDNLIISEFNIQNLNPYSVLFQAGYLTLKSYDNIGDSYVLISPNLEVRRSLQIVVLNAYRNNAAAGSVSVVKKLYNSLKNNQLDLLQSIFNEIIGGLPYDLWEAKREKTYQAIIHLTFTLAGMYVQSEVHTHNGRLDSVVDINNTAYIFEFKLDKSAEEAIAQIEEKDYANRYKSAGKKCIGIGVNFKQEQRVVENILWKEL